MKKKVLSLAALALFMVSNLDAAEESFAIEESHKCDIVAQDKFDFWVTKTYRSAAYEISEIAYDRCMLE